MSWTTFDIPTADPIVSVVATHDGLCAVSSKGNVFSGAWQRSLTKTRELGFEAGGAAWDDAGHRLLIAGRGRIATLRGSEVQIEPAGDGAALRSLCGLGEGRWAAVGQNSVVAGILITGAPGRWEEVRLPGLSAGLYVVVYHRELGCLLAGQRGFLAWYREGSLHRIASETLHPLRAAWPLDIGAVVAGGGWAQPMPIVLNVGGETATPLLTAAGERVICGICRLGQQTWLAENRSSGQGWTGMVTILEEGRVAGRFEENTLNGITAIRDQIVVWGSRGLVATHSAA